MYLCQSLLGIVQSTVLAASYIIIVVVIIIKQYHLLLRCLLVLHFFLLLSSPLLLHLRSSSSSTSTSGRTTVLWHASSPWSSIHGYNFFGFCCCCCWGEIQYEINVIVRHVFGVAVDFYVLLKRADAGVQSLKKKGVLFKRSTFF